MYQSVVRIEVKTAVVGVPCGIEGSMVNEFVEAQGAQQVNSPPSRFVDWVSGFARLGLQGIGFGVRIEVVEVCDVAWELKAGIP